MNILILSKRQYTGKDLLDDRYGRLYEISYELASQGAYVHGVVRSYRKKPDFFGSSGLQGGRLEWDSISGNPVSPLAWRKYILHVMGVVRDFSPDVIWASSDVFHLLAARHISKVSGIPYVADLYDNYESFGLTKIPGARYGLRKACRDASGITVVTNELADYIMRDYGLGEMPVRVIGNAVNAKIFRPQDVGEARQVLGLPSDVPLVGTAGALYRSRDIETLFRSAEILRDEWPSLKVVVAGPRDRVARRYLGRDYVIDLGVVKQDKVATLFSALDVGVVCNLDSSFGRYCYPQKYNEMLACHLQVVAADVGEMSNLPGISGDRLYRPGRPETLVKAVDSVLKSATGEVITPPTWEQRARELMSFLSDVAIRTGRDRSGVSRQN